MTDRWRSGVDLTVLRQRASMVSAIRGFFEERAVLEVETPIMSRSAVTDLHLDSFALDVRNETFYLNTSPEYHLKRLVAEHGCAVYQLAHCFREGEAGPQHNPEFSMLEWYRPGFGSAELIDEVIALLGRLATMFNERFEVRIMSYADVFTASTGLDPHRCTAPELAAFAERAGLDIPVGLGLASADELLAEIERDAWLDWIMSCHVVPGFACDQLTVITDYPSSQAALARTKQVDGRLVADRFECYLGTTEVANGYHELTDAEEQTSRFERDNQKRETTGRPVMPVDELLLGALQHGLPDCAGVAVGVDRVLMRLIGADRVSDVLAFSWDRI